MSEYTILGACWFSTMIAYMGVVAIETDQHENDIEKRSWKAYLGTCQGYSERADMQSIAAWGVPLTEQQARGFFPEITRRYKDSKP